MNDTSTNKTDWSTDIIRELFEETLPDWDCGDHVNAAAERAQHDTVADKSEVVSKSGAPQQWNGDNTTDRGETPLLPGDETIDRSRNNMVKPAEVSQITLGEAEARALKLDDDRPIESNALHQNITELANAELGLFVEESFEDYAHDLREKSVEQQEGAVQSFGYSIKSPQPNPARSGASPLPRRGEGSIGSVDQNCELFPQREEIVREHALERMREPKVITDFPEGEGSLVEDDLNSGQRINTLNPTTRDELFQSSTEPSDLQDQEPGFSEPRATPGAGPAVSESGRGDDILNRQLDEQTKIVRALDEMSRQGLHFVTGVGLEGL